MKKTVGAGPLKRRLLLIALTSLLLASALELYTFGVPADFLSRWFSSFFVFFFLLALTLLAIIPAVAYVVGKFAGR